MAQVYGDAAAPDGAVVRAAASPLQPDGGLVVLKGNVCPDGALLKVAGLKTPQLAEYSTRIAGSVQLAR